MSAWKMARDLWPLLTWRQRGLMLLAGAAWAGAMAIAKYAPDDIAKRAWLDGIAAAERKRKKVAQRQAREERKRMRRAAVNNSVELYGARTDLRCAIDWLDEARAAKDSTWLWASDYRTHEDYVADHRADVREAELRYAIACYQAGAVPRGQA